MEVILYLFKVNLAIAIFCLVYMTFYRKDTFFSIRRYLLLSMLLLSALYPFIDFSFWIAGNETIADMAMSYKSMLPEIIVYPLESGVSAIEDSMITIYSLFRYFLWFYTSVTCFLLLRILFRALQIILFRLNSDSVIVEGVRISRLNTEISPFSFFTWIFINPDMHDEKELHEVLIHEMVHVRQRHSADILVAEFICAFCWINPLAWMIKKEMQKNLEFLVDNCVINQDGVDMKSYQYHLLNLAYYPSKMKLTNQFNISPLKERIIMINIKKSPKIKIIAYTLIIPLVMLFLIANNVSVVAERISLNVEAKNVVVKASTYNITLDANTLEITGEIVDLNEISDVGRKNSFNSDELLSEKLSQEQTQNDDGGQGDFVFINVEKMPEFPGGNTTLLKYISENLKYPIAAAQKGIQGRVSCTFIVNTDGSISNVDVIKSIDPLLDDEAKRVIKSLPRFIPGEQRGRKVAVKYLVPVKFNLER